MNEISFDAYPGRFDYEPREARKIRLPELLERYANGEVQSIDIGFTEVRAAWRVGIARKLRGDVARDYMKGIQN